MAGRTGRRPGPAPYQVGDVVRGPEALPPGDYRTPATYEGEVVQVGSGWNGVDADHAYLWIRLRTAPNDASPKGLHPDPPGRAARPVSLRPHRAD
ncbi:hypothetical protein [Streptomyces subrutilus]|uniref:hypothetical protein n=1 Tax=Streptomyces subrutilus TaxID=36818 RepID=UPI001676B999|nr:hypothetical protein [Streptomyces subrutilus]